MEVFINIYALDPEKLMQCPYDKSHQIRACRFPYHLVKCQKNHLDIVQQLVTCPFNARHQIPKEEISQHISSCDDKRCIEQDIASQVDNHRKQVSVLSSWQSPPCEEDWDKGKTLMVGTHSCFPVFPLLFLLSLIPSSGSNTAMSYKSHLASGLRAPKSMPNVLPWKNSK
uniref:Gametocyte specific factor 1 n=1 Tax=Varanus komodoensis TaxID=61221 RepID=A0A8D2LAV4_VARKO